MRETDEKKTGAIKPIPEPTFRRLPVYYQYLKKMRADKGYEYISSTQIGNDLNMLPIQVRKDLQITEDAGKPKLGYDVIDLMATIENFLGWNNSGRVSRRRRQPRFGLLGYQGFKDYGLNIIAAFDVDERKIGTEIHETNVLHVSKLPSMIRRMGIK